MLKYVLALGVLLGAATVAHARCGPNESLVSTCSDSPEAGEEFWNEWNKRRSIGPGPMGPGRPRLAPGERDWYREGRGDWNRGRGGQRSTFVSCQAKDVRGNKFTATAIFGRNSKAQRQALNSCYANSARPRTCRPVGCFSVRF